MHPYSQKDRISQENPSGAARPARPRSVLLTLQQASAEYGPPATSLRDLVLRGLLPRVRFGDDARRIWIRREDLERLIEASTERVS